MTDVAQPDWMENFQPQPWEGKWKPGVSGNPAGKPRGITDKRSKLMKRMLDDANDIYDGLLEKARAGDPTAAGLIFARILPTLRAQLQTVQFDFDPSLPIGRQIEAVLAAVAAGEVPTDLGQSIVAMIGTLSTVRATEELELRIVQLEAKTVS